MLRPHVLAFGKYLGYAAERIGQNQELYNYEHEMTQEES
jgi:hypothetical protein